MKTYAESQGQKSFDWKAFLKHAKAKGLSDVEWKMAQDRSKDWVTCATGNQCCVIPRDEQGRPLDEVAAILGANRGFHRCIETHNPDEALHFLRLIEIHSTYLISIERRKRSDALKAAQVAMEEVS